MAYNNTKLARMRADAGLTQREAAPRLARVMGRASLHRKSLSNVECGRERPSVQLLEAMAKVYKVAMSTVVRAAKEVRAAFEKEKSNVR